MLISVPLRGKVSAVTTDAPLPLSLRFRAARERAGLSRDDAATDMGVPVECVWEIESQDDELCTSYAPADIRHFCKVLGVRPADLFLIKPDEAEPPITAEQLVKLIREHCRSRKITLPAFENAVGWRLSDSLDDPLALFEDLSLEGLRWVCDELGVDWRQIIVGL